MPALTLFDLPSPVPLVTVNSEDFDYFRDQLSGRAGIFLSNAKTELLQSRLRSRVHELGLEGFKEYRAYLERLDPSHEEWQFFVNLLTTNKTDWFREPAHFDYLVNEFLPAWKKTGRKKLSVWSAASSTGEEPYTLSIVLHHALKDSGLTYEIQATDLDTNVLAYGQNGVYKRSQLQQIPEKFHKSSFALGTGDICDWIKVRPGIKKAVTFQVFNLMTTEYPWNEKFDLIFCRNVMIYFPKATVAEVARKLYGTAVPGGALLIGHSESVQNMNHDWDYIRPSILEKGAR